MFGSAATSLGHTEAMQNTDFSVFSFPSKVAVQGFNKTKLAKGLTHCLAQYEVKYPL